MEAISKVFAIVLNYNGKDCLEKCLDGLYCSDYEKLEVFVIDNDSNDGSFESAKEKFPTFCFIKNPKNVGFSAGNNVGIRIALDKMADYVLLLNNDAYLEKSTIKTLVSEGDALKNCGILSPVIMSESGKDVWFAGGKILWKKMRTAHLQDIPCQEPYATEYVSGCCMMIKRRVFEKIGLLDENYFLYYEDADFSWRASLANFELKIIPSASIVHAEKSNQKNSSKLYWLVLSGIRFFLKNSSGINKLWIIAYLKIRKTYLKLRLIFSQKTPELEQLQRAFKDCAKKTLP